MIRRVVYSALLFVAALISLHGPSPLIVPDFFQEYASARWWWQGENLYGSLRSARQEFLALETVPDETLFVEVNAHPPVAVLLVLPLGRLEFPTAFSVWNGLSLAALIVALALLAQRWEQPLQLLTVGLMTFGLVLSLPFQEQIGHGQLNAVLLVLMIVAWRAWRAEQPVWVGLALGSAAALKLFPAFLFLPLLVQCNWRAIGAGGATFVGLNALAALVLGVECFEQYLSDALPQIGEWRGAWANISLSGLWHKAFDPGSKGTAREALVYSPQLARELTLMSWCVIVGATAWRLHHWRRLRDPDAAFALSIVAMLLVSPTTWPHYFLLLPLSLAVLWTRMPATLAARFAYFLLLVSLAMNPITPWQAVAGVVPNFPTSVALLTLLSWQTTVLVMLWVWLLKLPRESCATGSVNTISVEENVV